MKQIQNKQKIIKISRKKSANQKSRDFCQIFVISKNEQPYPTVWIKKSIENL